LNQANRRSPIVAIPSTAGVVGVRGLEPEALLVERPGDLEVEDGDGGLHTRFGEHGGLL
jgi:hypothetical protein